jgi:hypothetical protein
MCFFFFFFFVNGPYIEKPANYKARGKEREGEGGSFPLQMGMELGGEFKEGMQPGRTLAAALYAA